jgi:hypothetical protein
MTREVPWKFLVCVGVLLSCINTRANDDSDTNRLQLFDLDIRGVSNSMSSSHYIYSVDWSRLPQRISWSPGQDALPLDLKVAARAARMHLLDDHKSLLPGNIDLPRITIVRLPVTAKMAESHGKDSSAFDTQWMVEFQFSTQLGRFSRNKSVVMLLDGSFADEVSAPLAKPAPEYHPDESGYDNPYARFIRPDFTPIKVQWNPYQDAFPLNLDDEIDRGRNYLQREKNADITISLRRIAIVHYVPSGAINHQGLNYEANTGHWMCEFFFKDKKNEYRLYMLLDGSITDVLVN